MIGRLVRIKANSKFIPNLRLRIGIISIELKTNMYVIYIDAQFPGVIAFADELEFLSKNNLSLFY